MLKLYKFTYHIFYRTELLGDLLDRASASRAEDGEFGPAPGHT